MDPAAQRELERISRIADERLRQIALAEELSGVGHWRITVSRSMTWSPAVFRIHGQNPSGGSPTLQEAIQGYHPKDRRRVARCLHRALEEGGAYEFRARMTLPDGSTRHVSSAGRSECDATGVIIGVVGIVQDVTMQCELEERRARLERDERLIGLGRLAAGVAHEINNPLAYVEINLRALEQESKAALASAPEWGEALQDCLDGVERIQTVISELDSFGRPSFDTGVQSMNDVASDAARLARSQLRSTTELRLHLGEPSFIFGDKRRLAQVVLNLIRNADQALAAQPGRIEVFTHSHDGEAWLEVTDNGPGIPAELRERIFEPFFTTKAPDKGTGLGLALSAEIMRRHDGALSLIERGSFGACFRLVLPEVEGGSNVDTTPTLSPPRQGKLLIVDDEVALLNAYRRLLEPTHTIETANSAASAIQILKTRSDFDLLVCDLMMPEMDGPEFFEILKEKWPHLAARTVFSSGAAMSERARSFIDCAHNACLTKPIRPADVERILARMEERGCLLMSA